MKKKNSFEKNWNYEKYDEKPNNFQGICDH